jgi:hypothetical protein
VHDAKDYKQRRMIVDTLGWEPFREWFYELSFRSWWQLNGCLGVPLYKIYRRKNEWRTEGPITELTVKDELVIGLFLLSDKSAGGVARHATQNIGSILFLCVVPYNISCRTA